VLKGLLEKGHEEVLHRLEQHLYSFSVQGLRTLLLAYRQISEDEFGSW
jgi:hypothetical protein